MSIFVQLHKMESILETACVTKKLRIDSLGN